MPIYEYRCTACKHKLEALQKLNDPPLQLCPHCNSLTLQKLISAVSFRLKGSGWYETDFKGEGKKHLHEGSGEAAPTTPAESAPTTTEAKPASEPKDAKESKATPPVSPTLSA